MISHAACSHPPTKAGRAACRRKTSENLTIVPTARDLETQTKITDILLKGRALMNHHGLNDWSLVWDRSVRRLGQCRYMSQEIGLSLPLALVNEPEKMLATVLHEIAHALVGPGHGHSETWQRMAIKLGVEPSARCLDNEPVAASYVAVCETCGENYGRHRVSKRVVYSCPLCCKTHNGGKYDERFILTFRKVV